MASAILGSVGVLSLNFCLVELVVVESVLLETAVASIVSIASSLSGAVNELLLGEGKESTTVDKVGSLEGSGG